MEPRMRHARDGTIAHSQIGGHEIGLCLSIYNGPTSDVLSVLAASKLRKIVRFWDVLPTKMAHNREGQGFDTLIVNIGILFPLVINNLTINRFFLA